MRNSLPAPRLAVPDLKSPTSATFAQTLRKRGSMEKRQNNAIDMAARWPRESLL